MSFSFQDMENNPNYKKIEFFKHDDVKEFLIRNIDVNGFGNVVFNVLVLMNLVFWGLIVVSGYDGIRALIQIMCGILTILLIIPIHELIHMIVYYWIGARNIRFGCDIKRFIFYVYCDDQVFEFKKLVPVLLSSFVIIEAVLLILFFRLPDIRLYFSTLLVINFFTFSGDYYLFNYYLSLRKREIYTFDKEGTSYFYERI